MVNTKTEVLTLIGQELNYYAGGNTAKGFLHFFESNLEGLERVFILKGGPGTGKSTFIRSIGRDWQEKGYVVEWIHCSSDVGSLDGVIIPKLKVGIVDGTSPHIIEPKAVGVIDDYVNLGIALNRSKLIPHRDTILTLNQKIKEAYNQAYMAFSVGLRKHDELEKIFIGEIDFEKAKQVTDYWIDRLIGEEKREKEGLVRHRFLGASTPKGPIDFIENLTENVSHRYFIKGRPGNGKSTMLKKIASKALERGFDVEMYHCGFDPKSLDMIIVRELDFAIFDSTAPHEHFPKRSGDELIDLYSLVIKPGTDEKYAEKIKKVTNEYKKKMKEGIGYLAKTKQLRNELESYYIQATDFSIVESIRDQVNEEIKRLAENLA